MNKLLLSLTLMLCIAFNTEAQASAIENGQTACQAILETGKRWVYKNYYRNNPDLPHPVPYYELLIGEKIQENGREMYATYTRNAGEADFSGPATGMRKTVFYMCLTLARAHMFP